MKQVLSTCPLSPKEIQFIVFKHSSPSQSAYLSVNPCQGRRALVPGQSCLSLSEGRSLPCATTAAEQPCLEKIKVNQLQNTATPQNLMALCLQNNSFLPSFWTTQQLWIYDTRAMFSGQGAPSAASVYKYICMMLDK